MHLSGTALQALRCLAPRPPPGSHQTLAHWFSLSLSLSLSLSISISFHTRPPPEGMSTPGIMLGTVIRTLPRRLSCRARSRQFKLHGGKVGSGHCVEGLSAQAIHCMEGMSAQAIVWRECRFRPLRGGLAILENPSFWFPFKMLDSHELSSTCSRFTHIHIMV